ncbi:MAG: hypothetical protein PHX26_00215 [Proteiniphilum sp.]|nr:hypothetical protein [Proteiniphilum sp.]
MSKETYLTPLGELGEGRRGIVLPSKAHSERSELYRFRRSDVRHRR